MIREGSRCAHAYTYAHIYVQSRGKERIRHSDRLSASQYQTVRTAKNSQRTSQNEAACWLYGARIEDFHVSTFYGLKRLESE